jgi:hypothetical protein
LSKVKVESKGISRTVEVKKEFATREEWLAEGERLCGKDMMKWKFKCPSCGHIASVQDYKNAGAPTGAVAFSCVGRWDGHMNIDAFQGKDGPCNYAGGGMFCINPVKVGDTLAFEFATDEEAQVEYKS